MDKARIQITYDGEALRKGSMDVRELAPALLAIGELCQESNFILNGDKAKVSVNVKSDFKKGSFTVVLELIQTLTEQAKLLIFGNEALSAKDLLEYLGLSAGSTIGVIKLIKLLRGHQEIEGTTLQNGNISIKIKGDNNRIEVKPAVAKLYSDITVRRSVKNILKPLEREGIDRLDIIDQKKKIQSINKEDLPLFEPAEGAAFEQLLLEDEFIAPFEIIKPSFDENLKWTLSDGNSTFNADIYDESFLERLQKREYTFGKGDVLKVKIRKKSWRTEAGMKSEYKIIEVMDIIPGPKQMPLI